MISFVKNGLYKTVGKATLSWRELQEVLLDIENTLNNRPLTYLKDDLEYPILTPNRNLETGNKDLCKRFTCIRKCKEAPWLRWRKEYIKSLREHHNVKTKDPMSIAKVGEVVICHSDDRNKGKWILGIITDLFPGLDNIVRAVRVKTSKSYLERAVQHLYPLELSCVVDQDGVRRINGNLNTGNNKLNPVATEFRPKRNAAAIAELKIIDITQEENEPPQVE